MQKSDLREIILYIFFGVLTVGVNLTIYIGIRWIGISVIVATLIAWVVAVLFAFYTNRKYVFSNSAIEKEYFLKEMYLFFKSRILTLIIEVVLTFCLISVLKLYEPLMKILIQGIVIILNYLLSKLYVFKLD